MNNEIKRLDPTGLKILKILQKEGRIPLSQLARQVNLTAPAVAERVRLMERSGIILGYSAEINPDKAGLPVRAFIRLRTPPERYKHLLTDLEDMPEVLECDHVTGEDAFYIKIAASSTEALESVIARLSRFGPTSTAVILSSPLKRSLTL